MSLSILQSELRTAIAKRDGGAANLSSFRARLAAATARRASAAMTAAATQSHMRDVVGADYAVAHDVATARAERDAAADAYGDTVLAIESLTQRIADAEPAHTDAVKAAAHAAEAVAVAIAIARRERFRAAVTVMASCARDFHRAAAAASTARHAATGSVGVEPVAFSHFAAANLMSARDAADGVRGILADHGIEPDLTPQRSRVQPLTESELLAVADLDEAHTEPAKSGALIAC